MQFKTQKLLVNMATGGTLLVGVVVLVTLIRTPISTSDNATELTRLQVSQGQGFQDHIPQESSSAKQQAVLNAKAKVWARHLRDPLYDPPPPPKVVVKPRPITVRLVGTILEPDNSQAFVRMTNGSVELKRIGDSITDNPKDGTVKQIAANEIVIDRYDGEHRLGVEQ